MVTSPIAPLPGLTATLSDALPRFVSVSFTEPIYYEILTGLLERVGVSIAWPDSRESRPFHAYEYPVVAFDGAGVGFLREIRRRPLLVRRNVAVITLKTHPAYLELLESLRLHVVRYRDLLGAQAGLELGVALAAAAEGDLAPSPRGVLSRTEREIVSILLAEGVGSAAIASEIGVAQKTVTSHVSNILRKLDLGRANGGGLAKLVHAILSSYEDGR
jgi:DNA-binding CsgD family transcriptional regulator